MSKEITDLLEDLLATESALMQGLASTANQSSSATSKLAANDIVHSQYGLLSNSKHIIKPDIFSRETSSSGAKSLPKSVSFGNGKDLAGQFTPIIDSASERSSQAFAPASILKLSLSNVTPNEIPMKPLTYDSDGEEIQYSSSSESGSEEFDFFKFPSDDEEGGDEDIEIGEEEEEEEIAYGSQFGADAHEQDGSTIDFQSFDGLLESLDEDILKHTKSNRSTLVMATSIDKRASTPVSYFGQAVPVIDQAVPVPHPDLVPRVERGASARKQSSRNPAIDPTAIQALLATTTYDSLPTSVRPASDQITLPDGSDDEEIIQIETTLLSMPRPNELNIRKVTTRVYIETANSFKTKTITSLMTTGQLVKEMTGTMGPSTSWTLFELCNELGIGILMGLIELERPLRDWEIVTDVLSAWDNSLNAVIVKKGSYPRIQGFLFLQLKPGKWQKRFCYLRDFSLYYLKDHSNPETETLLVNLSSYDIYTTTKKQRKSATEFCFAIRSDMNASYFIDQADYIHFLCVEKQERLIDWVLALRLAKSERMVKLANSATGIHEYPTKSHTSQSSISGSILTAGSLLEATGKKKRLHRSSPESSTRLGEKNHIAKEKGKKKSKPLVDL